MNQRHSPDQLLELLLDHDTLVNVKEAALRDFLQAGIVTDEQAHEHLCQLYAAITPDDHKTCAALEFVLRHIVEQRLAKNEPHQ